MCQHDWQGIPLQQYHYRGHGWRLWSDFESTKQIQLRCREISGGDHKMTCLKFSIRQRHVWCHSWPCLVKSKLPMGPDLNQVSVGEKMSNSFITKYSNQYIIYIGTIHGFKVLAVDWRRVLIQFLRVIYDGVDAELSLGNHDAINGEITKFLAFNWLVERSTYHFGSLPTWRKLLAEMGMA